MPGSRAPPHPSPAAAPPTHAFLSPGWRQALCKPKLKACCFSHRRRSEPELWLFSVHHIIPQSDEKAELSISLNFMPPHCTLSVWLMIAWTDGRASELFATHLVFTTPRPGPAPALPRRSSRQPHEIGFVISAPISQVGLQRNWGFTQGLWHGDSWQVCGPRLVPPRAQSSRLVA